MSSHMLDLLDPSRFREFRGDLVPARMQQIEQVSDSNFVYLKSVKQFYGKSLVVQARQEEEARRRRKRAEYEAKMAEQRAKERDAARKKKEFEERRKRMEDG